MIVILQVMSYILQLLEMDKRKTDLLVGSLLLILYWFAYTLLQLYGTLREYWKIKGNTEIYSLPLKSKFNSQYFFPELDILNVNLTPEIWLHYKTLTVVNSRSSLIYNTSARHEWHECDTSATPARHEWNTSYTSATQVRHECETSATRTARVRHEWKNLILITTLVKTYFHTLIFTIWQVKDYKERNNFILRTSFWKCVASMPKCV